MTVRELISALSAIQNQDAEVILEDSILDLAVKLTKVKTKSFWQDNAIDLCGSCLPGESPEDSDEEEED